VAKSLDSDDPNRLVFIKSLEVVVGKLRHDIENEGEIHSEGDPSRLELIKLLKEAVELLERVHAYVQSEESVSEDLSSQLGSRDALEEEMDEQGGSIAKEGEVSLVEGHLS